MSKHHNEVQRI